MLDNPPDARTTLMDDNLFRRFCDLIHDEVGLAFTEKTRYFLEKRIEMRLSALRMRSALDYWSYLQYDTNRQNEWDALIAAITTNETYFMREERQLLCFRREILPELLEKAGGRKVKIWSSGCSSGEEPYSIAMIILETPGVAPAQVDILASDVNVNVLQKARAGIYGPNSFRAVEESFRSRWFTEESAARYLLKPEVRNMVTFTRFNLFDMGRYALLSQFDVIFCRNVIIYFDLDSKVKVMDRFHDKLRNGGYLLLGHSESLISVTDKFRLVHLNTDLVYRKEGP